MTLTSFSLPVAGTTVAGLRSPGTGGQRVLALHGWLDNAASFVPLAAQLPGLELVAIDLPGHGHSAHLPPGTQYNTPGAICHVLDVADALGWDRFVLLGHSMGAGIASLAATAAPERVERLIAIEALGGLRGPRMKPRSACASMCVPRVRCPPASCACFPTFPHRSARA